MFGFVNSIGLTCQRPCRRVVVRWVGSTGSGGRGNRLALIGLGNPGGQFQQTRHNIGFEVADAFAARHGGKLSMSPKFLAETTEVQVGGKVVMIVKPMTFMNLSGTSVRKVVDFYKLPLDALIIVTDDVRLDLGTLRLRAKGSAGQPSMKKKKGRHFQARLLSAKRRISPSSSPHFSISKGGHNGLKHIEKQLSTQSYPRLKVGVDGPNGGEMKDYVLGKFKRSEQNLVEDVIW